MPEPNNADLRARGAAKANRVARYLLREYVTVRTEAQSQFIAWRSTGPMVAYHILCEIWQLRRMA